MRVCELGESHMHLLVAKQMLMQLVQEEELRVLPQLVVQ
jgi:hypothetical protein